MTGAANPRWAGDGVSVGGGRQRARRLFPGDRVCQIEGCGKRAERHHIDGDTRNNDAANIAFLCNKHHKEADGRMHRPAFRAAANRRGTKLSAEHRAKIAHGNLGRRFSEESKARLSAAATARYARTVKPAACPHGHPYDDANSLFTKDGKRHCRECGRIRSKRNYYRRKGAA